MRIQKTESGLYVPSAPRAVNKTECTFPLVTHDKLGLQVQPSSYLKDKGFLHYSVFEDKYILISVDRLEQKGMNYGFCMYGGEGRAWGHPPFYSPCLMSKEQAEDRLEYYKEVDFLELT